jgi:hypothetical protein
LANEVLDGAWEVGVREIRLGEDLQGNMGDPQKADFQNEIPLDEWRVMCQVFLLCR